MLVWPLHGETCLENGDSMSTIWPLDVYYAVAIFCMSANWQHRVFLLSALSAYFHQKKAVPDPMSLKWLFFVFIWQRGPLFNSKSLCYSELSRILTCVFQSMMPHLHTLLGRQSPDPVQADSQHGNDPYLHAPEDALVLRAQLSKASESESSHPAVVWATL